MSSENTSEWCSDPLDLFRLASAAHNGFMPPWTDAICLFGHTPNNEDSVLIAARKVIDRYEHSTSLKSFDVYISGGGPYRPAGSVDIAYSGFDQWQKALAALAHIDRERILPTKQPTLSHTHTESEAFVSLAREKMWTTMIIVAWGPQILRAFTNVVSFVERTYPGLSVYPVASAIESYGKKVLLNQGEVIGTILDRAFQEEWDRINRWHAKGDLISAGEVLDYVRRRDAAGTF